MMKHDKYQDEDKKRTNKSVIKSIIKPMLIFIAVHTIVLLLLIWLSQKYYVPAEM
ncbi:MAG: hypothetical protein A4E24_00732 [Methanomethylovorans sp. PtaU1.Bin093]|nr:MAG: hypothetical protein A4E24_00732 [Methanomethylovorans sp. PtaU1.Bin093]